MPPTNHVFLKNDNPNPRVLAILTQTWGSTPQTPGAKMWVSDTNFDGTLGGGQLELQAIERARQILKSEEKTAVVEFNLSRDLAQCCGGKAQIYFEKQMAATPAVCFGSGHVGQQLSEVLANTQVQLHLVDSRGEWLSGSHATAQKHNEDALSFIHQNFEQFPRFVFVMTHSHELDEQIIDILLTNPRVKHIGLIGSATKWARFKHRLLQIGHSDIELQKIQCPVGVFKGESKEPREIAISIAAQLLAWTEQSK